jgi:hypothetical protein
MLEVLLCDDSVWLCFNAGCLSLPIIPMQSISEISCGFSNTFNEPNNNVMISELAACSKSIHSPASLRLYVFIGELSSIYVLIDLIVTERIPPFLTNSVWPSERFASLDDLIADLAYLNQSLFESLLPN